MNQSQHQNKSHSKPNSEPSPSESYPTSETLLKDLPSSQLLKSVKQLAAEERRITAQLIEHLEEIERRKLHLELGYGSLFDFVRKHLGYSESSAQRRIDAMRLSRELPEVRQAVQDGKLTLSTVGQVQKFLRHERKNKKSYSTQEKRELLTQLEGLSSRECERTLAAISPQFLESEKVRAISDTQSQITFAADAELMQNLERIKNLWAHQNPRMSYAELFGKMAEFALDRIDPMRKPTGEPKGKLTTKPNRQNTPQPPQPYIPSRNTASTRFTSASEVKLSAPRPPSTSQPTSALTSASTSASISASTSASTSTPGPAPSPNQGSRHIPASIRREVWRRDQARCTYIHPQSGRRCDSSYMLEIDHIHAYACGGTHELDNLRLLCRAHNVLHGLKTFGPEKMKAG